MTRFVLPEPPTVAVPVAGDTALFPVRRVYCVGRNYAAHAREMGFSDREPPFFFAKPDGAVVPVPDGTEALIQYPGRTQDFQHEIELVVAIGQGGRDIAVADALRHAWGYAVGLDMTRRDAQLRMREQGRPWEVGKAFDHSAPIGPLHPVSRTGHPRSGRIWLDVDGVRRQYDDIAHLTWSVAETLAHLSTWFDLEPGDLVYTGTPAGVGPVGPGQVMTGGIDGLGTLRVRVAEPTSDGRTRAGG